MKFQSLGARNKIQNSKSRQILIFCLTTSILGQVSLVVLDGLILLFILVIVKVHSKETFLIVKERNCWQEVASMLANFAN
jgi:hypothetical protein